jgi:hypothetical protein
VRLGRALAFLFLSLLSAVAAAAEGLVLIPSDQARPQSEVAGIRHDAWVLWPRAGGPDRENRLLTLVTGLPWRGEARDLLFRPARDGWSWRAENADRLRERGHFEARQRHLGHLRLRALAGEQGAVPPAALLLALDESGLVSPVRDPSAFEGDLLVAAVKDWEEAGTVARAIGGRVLVLEYPPSPATSMSRFWRLGTGWPEGEPAPIDPELPGVVQAADVLPLLVDPQVVPWTSAANRGHAWFGIVRNRALPVNLALAAAVLVLSAFGIATITNERRSRWIQAGIFPMLLLPAAVTLGGEAVRLLDVELWLVWHAGAWLGLVAVAGAVALALTRLRRDVHPIWVAALVGFPIVALLDPGWSLASPLFGRRVEPLPGFLFGGLFVYATWLAALAPGRFGTWFSRLLLVATAGVAAISGAWWLREGLWALAVPAIALFAGAGTRWGTFGAAGLAALALVSRVAVHGVAWAPAGLLNRLRDLQALDLSRHVMFLASPLYLGTLFAVGILGLFGDRFFLHQIHRLWLLDARFVRMVWAPLAGFLVGLMEPALLHASLVALIGVALAHLFEGVRSL